MSLVPIATTDLTQTPGPWRLAPPPGSILIVLKVALIIDPAVDLLASKFIRYRRYTTGGTTPFPIPPSPPGVTPAPPSGPTPAGIIEYRSIRDFERIRTDPIYTFDGLRQYVVSDPTGAELYRLRASRSEYVEVYLSDASLGLSIAPLVGSRAEAIFVCDVQPEA